VYCGLKDVIRIAHGRCKDLVQIRQCTNSGVMPSSDLIERFKDNELHRINCENNIVMRFQSSELNLSKGSKQKVAKSIRQLYTIYKANSVMPLEFPVSECLKERKDEFSFSEMQLNLITHGPDQPIDLLKSSLISKYLEASTDVYFSVAIALMMLRTLFVQKV
jgi:hypothetical protein